MDMVEENGANSIDSMNSRGGGATGNGTDSGSSGLDVSAKQMHNNNNSDFPANILTAQTPGLTVLKSSPANIVHLLPSSAPAVSLQSPQSVIQSSVIQSANNMQPSPLAYKVVYANKGNSVIQAPGIKIKSEPNSSGSLGAMDSNSDDDDDSCSDDDTASKKRRDMLTRRPSYHKILKEISGPDMSVIPTTTLQLAGGDGMHVQGSNAGQMQYISGQDFYVPAVLSGPVVPEDQSRKREIRLQKNREAARECRRKKKEYIKCLENRVAVLENQNKALIEELKTLKELYCMTKTE